MAGGLAAAEAIKLLLGREAEVASDLFIFDLDDGMDQVFDFATGIDQVQLVGSTSYTMLESGGNTFVTFGSTEIVFRDAILTAGDIDAIL